MTRCARIVTLAASLALACLPAAGAAAPERHASMPAASPDGRWVAYVRATGPDSCELRIVRPDGSGDRAVARIAAGLCVPGWTEGGARLTFAVSTRDTSTLTSLDPDGGDPRVLARGPHKSFALSHDGRMLAYAAGTWTRSRLVVAEADGSRPRALGDSTAGWFNIAWSPDDRTLAATRLDPAGALQVWLVEAATGRARALTAFRFADGRPQWPAWSPDGRRIAVQMARPDHDDPTRSESDIWIVTVASGRAVRITRRPRAWLDETPTWLADGRHLVIQSTRTGRFELWRMRDDGSQVVPVTR